MSYKEMSDFEINKEVAQITDFDWYSCDGCVFKDSATDFGLLYDPCNNPSDAWPIIVENRISVLIPDDGTLTSEAVVIDRHIGYDDDEIHCQINHSTQNDNPLRAAMICFLKIKDAEK